MSAIDITFLSILCYVLGLLLRIIPDQTGEYWKIAGLCYGVKMVVWFTLRVALLLPIDRWRKQGMPPDADDPSLIRSIYYFPYDFSLFYGVLVFGFYAALVSILVLGEGPIVIQEEMLNPGLMFAAAAGFGAVAIGVPVNLLLTARFSQRLSERKIERFSELPGKRLSLQTKVATVAIALGCAPSLLLFSIQSIIQYDGLYLEAERIADLVVPLMRDGNNSDFLYQGVHPFVVGEDGELEFASDFTLPSSSGDEALTTLLERRLGYVVRFVPGDGLRRGVVVEIPEPEDDSAALTTVILLACTWPILTSVLTVLTIVRPVSVIAASFHRIIGRGWTEESDKIPIFYKDEVGRLAFNANRTIDILTNSREQLEESTKDLIQKNRELQEAYRTKGDFLANMSHELRTPLNAIIGFSNLMKRKLKGTIPERQEKNLEMVLESGEQLLVLVNDLLDFERIEAGKLSVTSVNIEIGPLLECLEESMRPLADAKGLSLGIELEDPSVTFVSDKERLRQILTNLITNAIKYSDKGRVGLRVFKEQGQMVFEVSDEGIGMTPEVLGQIFSPFHQVDGSQTRERGGVGLGLAIVNRLVRLLNGQITVESEWGRGSVFTVSLPLERPTPELPKSVGAHELLVVEDDPQTALLIEQALEESGMRARFVDTEEQARQAIEEDPPTRLVTDLYLSQGSGWSLLDHLRRRGDSDLIKVFVYTASDIEDRELERLTERGVTVVPKHSKDSLSALVRFLSQTSSEP